MIPIGAITNSTTVIFGSLIGTFLHDFLPERIQTIVFQGMGLCLTLLGVQMVLKTENLLIVISSLLIGGIIGDFLNLEGLFEKIATNLKALVGSQDTNFTDGLITASLMFCTGAMGIVGALDEGIRGDTTVLYSKSTIGFFNSMALASNYGIGVLFAFIPVLLYIGGLTIFANSFKEYFTPSILAQLTSTGGFFTIAIGLSILKIKRLNLTNFLPSLPIIIIITQLFSS